MKKLSSTGIILDNLRNLANQIGKTPTREDYEKSGLYPSKTCIRKYFGSWNNAIEAAGLEVNARYDITEDAIVLDIQRVARDLGYSPSRSEYLNFGKFSDFHKWGGWKHLVTKAGLKKVKDIEKVDLFIALNDVIDDLGYTPTYREFSHHPKGYSSGPIYRNFTSYDDFIDEAGCEKPDRKNGYSGIHITCSDGHIVHSYAEQLVDEFLCEKGIFHKIQVRVCTQRYWTCDFVLPGNLWVEVDGFINGRKGDSLNRFNEKIDYYKQNGYSYLVIRPYNENWKAILLDSFQETLGQNL